MLAVTAALAGCTADRPQPAPSPAPNPVRLVAFDSCRQLRDDLRAALADSVGPYGFPGGVPGGAVPESGGARTAVGGTAVGGAPVGGAPVDDAEKTAGSAYSGTNVYEPGADEPDIVKTDGRRIVTLSQGTLRVVDAATRRQTGRLDLRDSVGGDVNLLLSGDKALVLVSGMQWRYRMGAPSVPGTGGSRLLLVDLAGAPRLISTYEGDGGLVDARQTGSTARVVLRSTPRISLPQPGTVDSDAGRVTANRAAIRKAPVDAWLPTWTVSTGGTTERGTVRCGEVSRPAEYSGAAMLTILTFDLGAARLGSGDPVAIVADGDTVYGTGTSLYVTNDPRWRLDLWPGAGTFATPRQRTEIYRFDTPAGRPPTFSASGTVPGWLINQYALSEWDNHLRVATTDGDAGSSAVRVLERRGSRLVEVGEVGGLGKGERIYSVRFVGPRGYVVTFRQTDPLYSVDLSDPRAPRVTGQLKITGYSAHLQPIGDNRLIGIGQEADGAGRVQGTQVSLFDVSDPADPRRLAQYQVTGAVSEAEWDPHALLWWPATQLLVVPMMGGGDGGARPAALALRVTNDGLTPAGTLRQAGGDPVRRSLVVGDVVWTMSDSGLQASSLSTLDPLDWLPAN